MSASEVLADAVAARLAVHPDTTLARSILGTDDPQTIAARVEAFCRRRVGAAVAGCLSCEWSVGAGFGLELDDGRRVFLKVHFPHRSPGALRAIQRVQAALAGRGFPCPGPILPPVPFGDGWATVDAYVEEGERADAHPASRRREMARALARQMELAREFVHLEELPGIERPRRAVWPRPHNALFDFERTREGAAWIDAVGTRARNALACRAGERAVGHGDWSAQNMRFRGDEIAVVYDWDSLRRDHEPAVAGQAAFTFPVTWYVPVRVTPTPEEARAFLEEYECARGKPFTSRERRLAAAAATYSLAYCARCEHAVDDRHGFREALAGMEGEWYIAWRR